VATDDGDAMTEVFAVKQFPLPTSKMVPPGTDRSSQVTPIDARTSWSLDLPAD
jgi:hypothetical protein